MTNLGNLRAFKLQIKGFLGKSKDLPFPEKWVETEASVEFDR